MNKKFSIVLIGGLILVIIVGTSGIAIFFNKNNSSNNTNNTSASVGSLNSSSNSSIITNSSAQQSNNTNTYKNGTYNAEGSYSAPSGDETIALEVTIFQNQLTSIKAIPESNNPEAIRYQQRFAEGVSGRVIGKAIDQISLSGENINGASLTGDGFNTALNKIKQQALTQ